jgi:hypothetical protein
MVVLKRVKLKFWSRYRVLARGMGTKRPRPILVDNEKAPLRNILIMLAMETVGPTKVSMNFLASWSEIIVL